MAGFNRRPFTEAELRQLWHRHRAGVSQRANAAALGREVSSVRKRLEQTGGMPPRSRHRAAHQVTAEEREHISRALTGGASVRAISRTLARAPSTISREIARNGGRRAYRAVSAERRAWQCATRPKRAKLQASPRLRQVVEAQLRVRWSPQQIAGWLRHTWPQRPEWHVSHETIYQSLYVQTRGALKRELTQYLRTKRAMRRPASASSHGQGRGQLRDTLSIAVRPPEVMDRVVPGHWEGDLLLGDQTSQIITLVERTSRFVQLLRAPRRDAETVATLLTRHVQRLPDGLMASLTWDQGKEMAQHTRFTLATNVHVYFCDPQSPWQRGTNENTNGLLRQYFPKGQRLQHVTQRQLDHVARELNQRPRETLGFRTPAEVFAERVALTT